MHEDPSATSLQVDCCVSQNDSAANSELRYHTIYHQKWDHKPNPSARMPKDNIESVGCVSSSPKLQSRTCRHHQKDKEKRVGCCEESHKLSWHKATHRLETETIPSKPLNGKSKGIRLDEY